MIPTFILAIENDDDRAFIEHIYKKYYNLMYSKAYDILQNRDCVDDVINNACIKLIPKIQKLRTFNCCVLASYIVYTVRSAAIDYMRKENIASSWLSIDDETQDNIPEDKDTPDELFIEKEKIERLLKALERLPEKQRLILQLKYFCDMSDKEIAEVFNISPHSIRAYLSRARKVLYKIIEKDMSYELK